MDSIIELQIESANAISSPNTEIHTGGGASIGKDVTTEGGNFVGRDLHDWKGESIYSIRADRVVINAPSSNQNSTSNNEPKEQIKTEPLFAEDRVTLLTGNEIGNGIRIGGKHNDASLNVVASSWTRYGQVSWVKSGWLYQPPPLGLDLAIAFFKIHLRENGTGYIHILSAANPVQTIWVQTKHFIQKELFCWDSDPTVQRTAVWHFRWQ